MRFLIVDDAAHVRESLRAIIELETGWQVVGEAGDSQQGMTLARHLRPDVVVLDAHLPGVDIMGLAHWLKTEATIATVVLLTIHDNPEDRARMLASGVDLCIAKGTGVAGLMDVLRAWLNQPAPLPQS